LNAIKTYVNDIDDTNAATIFSRILRKISLQKYVKVRNSICLYGMFALLLDLHIFLFNLVIK